VADHGEIAEAGWVTRLLAARFHARMRSRRLSQELNLRSPNFD
jgi:hypothetical protein